MVSFVCLHILFSDFKIFYEGVHMVHITKLPKECIAQKMLRTSVYIYKLMCDSVCETVLEFAIEHCSSAYKDIYKDILCRE